jgi:TPR repeat protein
MTRPRLPALHAVVVLSCAFCQTGALGGSSQAPTPANPSASTSSPSHSSAARPPATPRAVPATYEALVSAARTQLANKQSQEAQSTAERAIRLDGERDEAHILAAAALRDQRQYASAVTHLQIALGLAPDGRKSAILRAITDVRVAALPADQRRKLDAVVLVAQEANRARGAIERTRLLHEFMVRSNAILDDSPFISDLWLLRAAASLELNYPETAWIAARKLAELGADESDEPRIRKIMGQLERKDWLGPFVPIRKSDDLAGIRIDFDYLKDHPALVCREGIGVNRGPGYYCDQMKPLALAGDAYWEEVLADVFNGGVYPTAWRTSDDRAEAIRWYRKAADEGFVIAAFRLSELVSDAAERFRWARKAAALGLREGQDSLARMYQSGTTAPPDSAEALRWFKRAASQKYVAAELNLAHTYRQGIGVTASSTEAIRWYHVAAQDAADPNAKNNVAWILATDPDATYRDGVEAILLAKAACDVTKNANDMYVDTLAAAYAEVGDWEKANTFQELAIDTQQKTQQPNADLLTGYQDRLRLYRAHQPYRESPAPRR